MKSLSVRSHNIPLPVFLPDATFGYVRSLTAEDLRAIGIPAVMMNSFHLMQKPGSTVVHALGGLQKFSGYDGMIMTDSGGFQAYSLIRQNAKFGSLTDKGIIFFPEGSQRKLLLTPEKSIQIQFSLGADIIICLDDCTHVEADHQEQSLSVSRTLSWAKRSKAEYQRQITSRRIQHAKRPLLYAVIQGGGDLDLRKRCAEGLLELGFDGFGFGGWPLDEASNLLIDILAFTRSVIPNEFPIHALGIGHPVSIVKCFNIGYDMFDCAMPTRDARHGRLYAFTQSKPLLSESGEWFKFVYLNDEENTRRDQPISPDCSCPVCTQLSMGYLYHLYKMKDSGYNRLATIHNLSFMTQLIESLRVDA